MAVELWIPQTDNDTEMEKPVESPPVWGEIGLLERSSGELRAVDCNLTSLCDHIQMEGFNNGSFSDVVVQAMGATYHLHRLILCRSSYFRDELVFKGQVPGWSLFADSSFPVFSTTRINASTIQGL
ncbi:hypothetical protein L1887_14650 [Cichorium endivia]|nr:hypothetical protein L1887_14650 [Cichorium endivia]